MVLPITRGEIDPPYIERRDSFSVYREERSILRISTKLFGSRYSHCLHCAHHRDSPYIERRDRFSAYREERLILRISRGEIESPYIERGD